MTNAKDVISKLTNDELLILVEEFKQITIPEESLTRKVVLEVFGKIDILVLQMNQLIWPILEVVTERLKEKFGV